MKFVWWFFALFLVVLFFSFFFAVNQMSGDNMTPTIKREAYMITLKQFLSVTSPRRGDLVLYKTGSKPSVDMVGRVIALPKEFIRFNNGEMYLNNNVKIYKVTEKYLSKDPRTYVSTEDGNSLDWTKINEFSYLVLPDKRGSFALEEHMINIGDIKGKVIWTF